MPITYTVSMSAMRQNSDRRRRTGSGSRVDEPWLGRIVVVIGGQRQRHQPEVGLGVERRHRDEDDHAGEAHQEQHPLEPEQLVGLALRGPIVRDGDGNRTAGSMRGAP